MIAPFTELWEDLRGASRDAWAVRSVILVGALLVALAFWAAGDVYPVLWVVQVGLAALVVLQPHTTMAFVYVLWVIGSWWAAVDVPWHWALLPAMLGLLLVHAGSALAASVPAQATVPVSVLRRWASRTALVGAVATGIWGMAGMLAQAGRTSGVLPALLGLVVLAMGLVSITWTRLRARD